MDIQKIQAYLQEHELEGWLLADFHARNTVAVELLGLKGIVTRRSFYFIPAEGQPIGIVHAIEKAKFIDLPGKITTYSSYKLLEKELANALSGTRKLAMEYSRHGRLPYIGLVDAGTIELVRSLGLEVVTSADLVANFQARLTPEQIAAHRIAANNLVEVKSLAFDYIRDAISRGETLLEYDIVRFMLEKFEEFDMETEASPFCAVDSNAGNPHYEPPVEGSAEIRKGSLILIDLWAKIKHKHAAYGDITWVAFAGSETEIPEEHKKRFAVIAQARDTAVQYIRKHIDHQPVHGSEVDNVCRLVIEEAGYGKFFTHRTGHSITSREHGPGPNIDNLETEDGRRLQRGHLFSIEPGIYMEDAGFRTEINVLIDHNGAEITTLPLQEKIVALF